MLRLVRKLGVWRRLRPVRGHERAALVYVDLQGRSHLHNPDVVRRDRQILKALGVAPGNYARLGKRDVAQLSKTHWGAAAETSGLFESVFCQRFLPNGVVERFAASEKSVARLHAWQAEALDNFASLLQQSRGDRVLPNMLCAVPTSGGKSLVAELALAQDMLVEGRLSFYVLPQLSLCHEKFASCTAKFRDALQILPLFLNNAVWSSDADLVICTPEKALAVLDRLLLTYPIADAASVNNPARALKRDVQEQVRLYVQKAVKTRGSHVFSILGTFVIDEVHLVTEPGRGSVVEMLISKLRILQTMQRHRGAPPLRIICLSATIRPRLEPLFQEWLGVDRVIKSDKANGHQHQHFLIHQKQCYRLVPEAATYPDGSEPNIVLGPPVEKTGELSRDVDVLSRICFRSKVERRGCLVFCPTKLWCEKLAVKLAADFEQLHQAARETQSPGFEPSPGLGGTLETNSIPFFTPSSPSGHAKIGRTAPPLENFLDSSAKLHTCIRQGVGYHHSGLSLSERYELEKFFREGEIPVLCCTTTLALGINLPVSRVCVRAPNTLDWTTFCQMTGRVGRSAECLNEVYLCVENLESDKDKVLALINGEDISAATRSKAAGSTHSQLRGVDLSRFVLQLFAIKRTWFKEEIEEMVTRHTLLGQEELRRATHDRESSGCATDLDRAILFLLLAKLLDMPVTGMQSGDLLTSPLYLSRFFLQDEFLDQLKCCFRKEFHRYSSYWPTVPNPSLPCLGVLFSSDLQFLAGACPSRSPSRGSHAAVTKSNSVKRESDEPDTLLSESNSAEPMKLYLSTIGLGFLESGLPLEESIDNLCLLTRISNIGMPLSDLGCLLGCCIRVDSIPALPEGVWLPNNPLIKSLYGISATLLPRAPGVWSDTKRMYNMILANELTLDQLLQLNAARNAARYFGMVVLYEYIYHELSVEEVFKKWHVNLHSLLHTTCIFASGLVRILHRSGQPDLALLFKDIVARAGGGSGGGAKAAGEDASLLLWTEDDRARVRALQTKLPILRGTRATHLYTHGIRTISQLRQAVKDQSLVRIVGLLFPVEAHYAKRSELIVQAISDQLDVLEPDLEEEEELAEPDALDEELNRDLDRSTSRSSSSSHDVASSSNGTDTLDRLMMSQDDNLLSADTL